MSSYTDLGTFSNITGSHGHTMFPEYRPLGSHRPYYGLISQTTVFMGKTQSKSTSVKTYGQDSTILFDQKRIGCRGVGDDVRSAAALKISGGNNFSNAGVIVDPKTEFYTTKSPFEAKPRNRKEAQASNYWPQYLDAEHEEMVNHQENGTGSLVSRHSVPKGAQFLRTKWVYDGKKGQDKKFVRFKARLTAMGNFQRGGVDYFETYASMMRTKTLRVLLQLLNSSPDHEMEHWDKKAGFPQRLKDEGVFGARTASGGWCVIVTHVDDLFPSYNKEGRGLRDSVFKALEERVKVKNEGPVKWVLKILIERDREAGVMKISQGQFVRKVLQSFGFDGGYSDHPYL